MSKTKNTAIQKKPVKRTYKKNTKSFDSLVREHSEEVPFSFTNPPEWFSHWINNINSPSRYQGLVSACIDKRSQNASDAQFHFYDDNNKEIIKHPLLTALRNPNPYESVQDLKIKMYRSLDLVGQAFWFIEHSAYKPIRIWTVPSLGMKLVIDEQTGLPKNYVRQLNGGRTQTYELYEILHFIDSDPNNMFQPLSLVQKASMNIEIEYHQNLTQLSLLKNDGVPKGLLSVPTGQNRSQEDLNRLKQHHQKNYGGSINAGKIPVTQDGINFVPIQLTPKELDYLSSKKASITDVIRMFGVPPIVLGEDSEIKYQNGDASISNFLTRTILPLVQKCDNTISLYLRNYLSQDIYCESFLKIPKDREQLRAEYELGLKYGAITLNDYRVDILEKEALPQYEKVYTETKVAI